jgi:hypothetical protein
MIKWIRTSRWSIKNPLYYYQHRRHVCTPTEVASKQGISQYRYLSLYDLSPGPARTDRHIASGKE